MRHLHHADCESGKPRKCGTENPERKGKNMAKTPSQSALAVAKQIKSRWANDPQLSAAVADCVAVLADSRIGANHRADVHAQAISDCLQRINSVLIGLLAPLIPGVRLISPQFVSPSGDGDDLKIAVSLRGIHSVDGEPHTYVGRSKAIEKSVREGVRADFGATVEGRAAAAARARSEKARSQLAYLRELAVEAVDANPQRLVQILAEVRALRVPSEPLPIERTVLAEAARLAAALILRRELGPAPATSSTSATSANNNTANNNTANNTARRRRGGLNA
jgi:hypothetical protein